MNKVFLLIISFSFLITAECQTVDFTFESSNGSFCNPVKVLFKQACTGNPVNFIWNFGNNKYSNKPNDFTVYTSAGTYTVKLIAIFKTTTLTISKTVTINPTVTANIGFDKNYLCNPGIINFTGSGSGNITNYEWNFGDGTAPVNTTSSAISHTFTKFEGNYVFLKTSANSGCSDTATILVVIKKPLITVDVSKTRGCIPATVNFTGHVTLPGNSTVTSYTWDFGDSTATDTTTAGNTASHTYKNVGAYFPSLSIVSSEGCTNTYVFANQLAFGIPPVKTVANAQKSPLCASDSAVFISTATNANRYYWEFGDGANASTTDTIIKHKYNTIGNMIVRVKPYFNECDAPTLAFPLSVIGVVANYASVNSCTDKNIYSFRDTSNGKPTSYLWDFGDGVKESTIDNPVHSFPVTGKFKATLYLKDTKSGCSDSISKIIYTSVPVLHASDSTVCKNSTIKFSILNNYADTGARYTWHVMDTVIGPVTDTSVTIVAGKQGSFSNSVIIDHGNGNCKDTLQLAGPVLVNGLVLDFAIPAAICLNTALTITNHSKPFFATDTIMGWQWNFGDSIGTDTAFQPKPYQYTADGTDTVTLIAVDRNGCSDTLSKIIQVNPVPFLHIVTQKDSLCFGESDTLIAFHNNSLLWSPAQNISCVNCDTTVVTPPASMLYYGTATNGFNCSVQDSSFIEVSTPFTATVSPSAVYVCQGDEVTIDVNPKGKKIIWSPATGLSDPASYNPVISTLQSNAYTVTLTDSIGCLNTSSAVVNIHVKSLPVVDAGPNNFYSKGSSFTFAPTYSSNVTSYLWSPAGTLTCSSCAIPGGIATSNQLYFVKVTSDSGCVASDSVLIGIDCNSSYILMPKAFTPNNDNLNDVFYPITIGIKTITKFLIFDRQGQVVFAASNFSPNNKGFGWDGKFKGANQPAGTYVYMMETICDIGEKVFKKGSFLLLR